MIVFSSNRDPLPTSTGSHIYVVNADGSDLRQVTAGPPMTPTRRSHQQYVIFL